MIERLYPGVYVTEIPFDAKPIDGVSTSTAPAHALQDTARDARAPRETAPDWTQHNDSDPGIALLQVLSWLGESLPFRASPNAADRMTHAQPGWGVVQGLALAPQNASGTPGLTVSPGVAITADGRPCESESTTSRLHARKP